MTDPICTRALDAIHHLSDRSPPWSDILEGARHMLGGETATLIMIDGDGGLLSFQQRNIDAAAEHDYVDHYFAEDIVVPVAANAPAGSWFDTTEIFSQSFLSRNSFYVDFMCRHRMQQLVTYILADDPQRRGGLTVQRSAARAPLRDPMNDASVRSFVVALRQGLACRDNVARQWFAHAEGAFASFDEALCLATPKGLVVRVSALAQTWLESSLHPLRMRAGRLWHTDGQTRGKFLNTLALAARSTYPIALEMAGASGRLHEIEMVRADARLSIGRETLVLVRFGKIDDVTSRPSVDALQATFGLTPAEARVLQALAQGFSARTYAQARQLSYHTVRSQIMALMQKMDCSRQVDLVRAAMRLK